MTIPLNRWGFFPSLLFQILLFCCILILQSGAWSPAFAQKTVRVLIINSYHQGFAWSEGELNGLKNGLENSLTSIELYIEHLDTKRHSPTFIFPLAERLLRAKYLHLQPDIIFTVDEQALKFLMVKKSVLFPDVPLVFCGVSSSATAEEASAFGMTGIMESIDFKGTLDLALSMHPATRHVAVVSDSTLSGFIHLNEFRKLMPQFKDRIDFIELFNLTREELINQLKNLPDHTVVILLSFFKDRANEDLSPMACGQLLSQNTDAPVYTAWDYMVVGGVLGGRVVSGHSQGEMAARLGLRIIGGENPENIGYVRESSNEVMFDYMPMKRFGISQKNLATETVIKNKPASPFERYKKFFATLAFIIAGLSLVVLILTVNIIRRKKAEDALTKQVLFLETLLDTIPHPIYFNDLNGFYLGCNHAFARLLGFERRDIVGKTLHDFKAIGGLEAFKSEEDSIQCNGGIETNEITLTNPDGETSYFVLNQTVFQDHRGKDAGIVGVMVDLTDQKLTQDALKRAEQEYRLIFENAPLGIFRTTREGRYIFANQQLARIYGFDSVEQLLSEVKDINTQIYLDPEDRKILLDKVDKEGMLTNREIQIRRRDGNSLWTSRSIRVELDSSGNSLYYDGFVVDIDDRKQADSRLKLNEARSDSLFRLSQMMDHEPEQIKNFALNQAVVNTSSVLGFLTYLDDSGKGSSYMTLAGDAPADLVQMLNQEANILAAMGDWTQPLEQNKPVIVNELEEISQIAGIAPALSKFGRFQCVPFFNQQQLTAVAVVAGKKEAYEDADLRYMVLVLDTMNHILSRKEGELGLLKAKEAAEAANISKNEFLANMSHEIRTPLNGILGMTELILQSQISPAHRNQLKMIREAGRSLLRVLNDILDLSKIEAGRLDLNLAPFELDALLDSVRGVFIMEAQHKGIELKLEIAPGTPPHLFGDADRLRQVLVNLVGNGIKFTDHGYVKVHVETDKPLKSEDATTTTHLIRFTVTDTGCGVAEGMMDRIFQSFTQGYPGHARKYPGTGLGLAISRRLVQLMKGRIWIDKSSSKGSVFVVIIPLEIAQETQAQKRTPEQPTHPASLTILVAEDNRINQLYAQHILEQDGHTVITANNGREALDILSQQRVDLVFMDISMPELDGLETAARIRSGENLNKNVPIVALTAHAMKGDRERFIEAGMDAYLSKPVEPSKLLASLPEAIERRKALSSHSS